MVKGFRSTFGLLLAVTFAVSQAAADQSGRQDDASAIYMEHCAGCHGPDLRGGGGPTLIGDIFLAKWKGRPQQDLFEKIKTSMPPATPGSLSDQQYMDLAFFLRSGKGVDPATLSGGSAKPTQITEWTANRGDVEGTGYSSLDLINATNVHDLYIAWRWKSDNFGPTPEYNLEATPLMVDGVLYATAGLRRAVVAIDARTGETLWMYRLDEGPRSDTVQRRHSGRGVSYGNINGQPTIFFVTPGYQLVALDAHTGLPRAGFGQRGIVDLKLLLDQDLDPDTAPVGNTSPPLVMNGVVVVGPALANGLAPKSRKNVQGSVVGIDAATGKRLWIFHTIPASGEYGSDTWQNGSNVYTGNAGVWGLISGDPKLGYVYLPVEEATGDHYGGHRLGDDLFSQSLVCLDVRTGKRVWHFQTVHHGIWDYDLSAPPVLLDIKTSTGGAPVVAEVTKQGFTFVFNRVTGKPIWPIYERKVPQSNVPGERTAPTQPFPSKPPPFDRQGVSDDDLNDLTPEILEEAKRIAHSYTLGPLYTPPTVVSSANKGTLALPGSAGGANWQGAVADPESGILYVGSMTYPLAMGLTHDPSVSDMDYVVASNPTVPGPFGLPLMRPPWGRITAIDLNKGKIIWQVANGDMSAALRDNPKLKGVNLPKTGTLGRAGLLVTKSLLFAGEGAGPLRMGGNGGGRVFRSYDKKTGHVVSEFILPGRESGVPMTYAVDGKQYIVVAVGDKGQPGELVALTLP
jgi:quinoprotein glucose dehydrogenase